jgi:hypothetical protein
MFQRLALAVSHVLLMTFLGGCAGPELVVGELDPDTETLILAQAWIGEFLGAAEGEVLGEPFQNPAAGLTIAFDADSLGRTDCFFCVTVTLDTVFVRTNVTVGDPVRLDLRYTTDGVERTLVLDRFSGAGGTANVLQGRAIIRPVDTSGPPTLDLRYLLQR